MSHGIKEEVMDYLINNCPRIFEYPENKGIYLLFQNMFGDWILIDRNPRVLELLIEKERHDLEMVIISNH